MASQKAQAPGTQGDSAGRWRCPARTRRPRGVSGASAVRCLAVHVRRRLAPSPSDPASNGCGRGWHGRPHSARAARPRAARRPTASPAVHPSAGPGRVPAPSRAARPSSGWHRRRRTSHLIPSRTDRRGQLAAPSAHRPAKVGENRGTAWEEEEETKSSPRAGLSYPDRWESTTDASITEGAPAGASTSTASWRCG